MGKIGNYEIKTKIAEGGMAVVYKGYQSSLGRPVAIKILKHRYIKEPTVVDYFNRESLIIARLIHPNIIHVIDRGLTDNGMPYFVMAYIRGTDIAGLMKKGGLSFNKKLEIIIQTCKALAYAHKNGVIHRDIKPANILVDSEGNALVTDFGIAGFFQQGKQSGGERKKEILGTPSYMSPEQKKDSGDVTFASDIYSLGVVMYELFTGKRLSGKPVKPSSLAPEIPAPLERVILHCLHPDPDRRPASVEAIKNMLFEQFQGAHLKAEQKKKAFSGIPDMKDIFSVLDVIRETETRSVYLLRHNDSDELMVAKASNDREGGVRAARLLMNLKHENIAEIKGVSSGDNSSMIVMEYLAGGSLAERMVNPYPWQAALQFILQVARGLQFAHQNRIGHGQLSPSNILFTESDGVRIADFGAGKNEKGLNQIVQTDILATGAILYKLILGFSPVLKGNSFTPHKQFKTLPVRVRRLIYQFLTQKKDHRFTIMKQAIDAIEKILDQAVELDATAVALEEDYSDSPQKTIEEPPVTVNRKVPVKKPVKKRKRFSFFRVFLLLIFIIVSAAGVVYYYKPEIFDELIRFCDEKVELIKKTWELWSG